VADHAERVAQPFDRGPGDEDRAFERVGGPPAAAPRRRGQQPVARADRFLAGVEQQEAAGAVGRLGHARREAGLAEQRRLLVARDPGDRERRVEQPRCRRAIDPAVLVNLRQDRIGHAEQCAQLGVPAVGANREQRGAAGVGDVGGVDRAAGQPPQEEAVDRAERELAARRALPRPGDMVEHPGDLGGREIGVEQQAGPVADQRLRAVGLEPGAAPARASVLPDDGAMDRFAGCAVPHHRGLALVGDSDRRDSADVDSGERLPGDGERVAPDVLGVVLDPAGPGIMLLKLALRDRNNAGLAAEQDGAGRGRALVYREDMIRPPHAPTIRCSVLARKGFLRRMGAAIVPTFEVEASEHGEARLIIVAAEGGRRVYELPGNEQQHYSDFFRDLARDFGTRRPHVFATEYPPPTVRWRPLLTENVHPQILVGYGDPAVLKTDSGWWLVATSNDAPDAFPILFSSDLAHWEPRGFAFPEGQEPAWTATGRNVADFWAP